MSKIRAKVIALSRGEGPAVETVRVSIEARWPESDVFVAADRILGAWAPTVYKDSNDKVDFGVTFEDGEQYADELWARIQR